MASYAAEPSLADDQATNLVTGDSGPGTAIKDMLPIPTSTQPVTNPDHEETADSITEKPTFSHRLAVEGCGETGLVEKGKNRIEVENLGWNERKEDIPAPLVGGMDNQDLWMLIRRFNKQMYHVKSVSYQVPGGLDLNIADEEEFSPDKLRANLERFYTTIIIGLLGVVKHVARLRSWRETRRTGVFCAVYFTAWLFDILVPVFFLTLLSLIFSPNARVLMFPPAPIALVSSTTGGVQKPKSGVLGSHDSATGAPETHKGEAAEQEASNFVNSIASVALSSATGKHPQAEPEPQVEGAGDIAPDPTSIAVGAADAKDVAKGSSPSAKHDKTKIPVETAMWTKMRPIMHTLGEITDTWERFGNALSPTSPFPKETYRWRLATLVMPLLGVSIFLTSYALTKLVTMSIGVGFFGDPIITPALNWLSRAVPNWQKMLELRNTVLKGIPTNAQLAITLLRIGEANRAPLPPPPSSSQPPPDRPAALNEEQLRATGSEPPLNATEAELDQAIQHDPTTAHQTGGADIDQARAPKHGHKGARILGLFKGTTKGAVKTTIGADRARATVGSHHARDRVGAVPRLGAALTSGPIEFKARYQGSKGHLYITTQATIPSLSFGSGSPTLENVGPNRKLENLHPQWTVAVADIVELRKVGGYGWKAKLVVGWSLDREVADGLEIKLRDDEIYKVTAMPLRDELFNRLVAMGGQKWEAW